ncbi:MAG: hypothetical protein QM484_02850 [Woeseiaceae bacterium]
MSDDMLVFMKSLSLFLFIFFISKISVAANVELIQANDWLIPKSSVTLLTMPAVSVVMEQLQKDSNAKLQVKYPGGDEGTLWANELRSWLVALGLSSTRIELVLGSTLSTAIELRVLK